MKFFFIFIFITSCDFTPRVGKEILKAQGLIRSYEYSRAVELYKKIVEKNPRSDVKLKILYQIGDLYSIYLFKHKEAAFYYKKILDLTKDSRWTLKTEERLAELYFSFLKNFKNSSKYYKKLSSFDPPLEKDDFYKIRYAISLFRSGEKLKALKYFFKLERKKGFTYISKSIFNIGLIYFEFEKYNKAIAYWKKYLKLEKNSEKTIEVTFLLANAYESKEDLKTAYNLYYSLLGKYPNIDVVRSRLKSIYHRRISRKR